MHAVSDRVMVLELADGWYVLDAYDARPADYLHLVNDARGIGIQNTRIAAGGYFVVDGFVDEFDFSKTDAENAAAEFLVYYGDRYPLGGQSR